MNLVLAVAGGSAVGGLLRYLLSGAIQQRSTGFPTGTLVVNVLGSFILGSLVRYAAVNPTLSPHLRLLLGAGFCGGFTTFSTFSVETLELLQQGQHPRAFLYITLSVVTSLAAAMAGMVATRALTEP